MKKLILIILCFTFFSPSKAQCPTNFVPNGFSDFSDTNGYLHTLQDYLLSGKILILDFYFLTCGSCMGSASCIESLYQYYGSNTGDVIVLAFEMGDAGSTDEECIDWANQYGMPNVPNFSQMGGEQNTDGFWGEFYWACGENGGFAQTYVVTNDFCCGDTEAINYQSGCNAYCGNDGCCVYDESDSLPILGTTYAHQGGTVNCPEIGAHVDSLLLEMVSLENHIFNPDRQLIKITNILGQPVHEKNNTTIFYIYNDGTVEKKHLLK